jgi:hypothetical protein
METISTTGGNLFDIANRLLGDANLWYIIAAANDISDPWLDGLVTLIIPDPTNGTGATLVAN